MGDEDWRLRELEREPPLSWLVGHLRRLWLAAKGPPPTLEPSDLVPPDAWPICPECIVAHHPVTRYCPACGEWVGPYRAMVYPDLIWIWGRGLWRLMRRQSVSKIVWFGLLCLGIGNLHSGVASILAHWFPREIPKSESVWVVKGTGAVTAAFGIVYAVAGARFLSAAKRTWGSWRELAADQGIEPEDA